MKKSDIEKQMKKDLTASTPSDFNAVWDKCVTPSADAKERAVETALATASDGSASMSSRKAKISVAAVAIVLLLCCIALIICITTLNGGGGDLFLPFDSGYFIIDINPSIRVNYDKMGVVTSAQGLNSDGEELLNGLQLDGLTYDKAAEAIFDRCVSSGYFSSEREDNAILMTASKSDGEKDEKMTAELNRQFTQKFEAKKIKGAVISDVDNTKWQKEAEKYGINGQKYELIMRYLDLGGKLDESEYENITIHELYSRINDLNKNNSKDK